jgi:hypothetical protein
MDQTFRWSSDPGSLPHYPTGRNLPQIRQPRAPEPSAINEKTVADFTRVVEQTGILKHPIEQISDE